MPSRLDVVVKVKQREQDRKLESFADALGTWRTARQAVEIETRHASVPQCEAGTAADWQLTDSVRAQALRRLDEAQVRFDAAEGAVSDAREAYAVARGRTESVQRLAQTRSLERRGELEKGEARANDELTLLEFARRASKRG